MIFDNHYIALSERIVLLKQSNKIILDRHQSTKLTTSLGWNRRSSDESKAIAHRKPASSKAKPFKTPNTESPAFTAKGSSAHSNIPNRDVSVALHQVTMQTKCEEIINLCSSKDSLGKADEFTPVSQKKRPPNRPAIVRQMYLLSGSKIKYAPNMAFLHAY
ncbi:hypothetical protein JTB14_023436 [Gonioctena quinquepunctata]|nr:hypothetical protein JTB14_023436 [Gonioctena quinquepunctata]